MLLCGEIGIRTPGTSRFNGFQDRRNRPLCHLSNMSCNLVCFDCGAKVVIIFFITKFGGEYFSFHSILFLLTTEDKRLCLFIVIFVSGNN